MYCTQCGSRNEEPAKFCTECGAALYQPGSAGKPPAQIVSIPNYLVPSIFVTLCCCLIPGIVAIVYAAQVNALIQAGDFHAARRASRLACIWTWVSFGLGLAFVLCYALLGLLGLALE
jgi:hypothetical protein